MGTGTDRQTCGCPRQRMTTTAPERQVRPKQRRCALRRVRRPTVTVRSGGWKAGERVAASDRRGLIAGTITPALFVLYARSTPFESHAQP